MESWSVTVRTDFRVRTGSRAHLDDPAAERAPQCGRSRGRSAQRLGISTAAATARCPSRSNGAFHDQAPSRCFSPHTQDTCQNLSPPPSSDLASELRADSTL